VWRSTLDPGPRHSDQGRHPSRPLRSVLMLTGSGGTEYRGMDFRNACVARKVRLTKGHLQPSQGVSLGTRPGPCLGMIESVNDPSPFAVPQTFRSHVDIGSLPDAEVKRMNHICVSNAHRYVYANYSDKPLLRFLQNRFFGAPAPVRRRDLQPIGSSP
jgi:hypothetical protein